MKIEGYAEHCIGVLVVCAINDPNCVLLAQVYRFLSRKDEFSGWFTIYIRQIGRNTAYHMTNYIHLKCAY